jgi:hypothetical protein
MLLALSPGAELTPKDAPTQRGFAFCAAREPAGRHESMRWSRPIVFGFLRALSTEQAGMLSSTLVDANRRWEARANPFLEDLEDGDPDEALAQWLAHGPLVARAALTAAHTRRCGGDGWCVGVIARGTACPAGFSLLRRGTPEWRRAQFVNWPFGYASWLRARSEADAIDAAKTLRAAASESTRIGLVLHLTDDEATRDSVGDLRDALIRHEVLRRAGSREDRMTTDAADATAGEAFPAKLDALDVVIFPRFEVVQDPASLEHEVHALAPKLTPL